MSFHLPLRMRRLRTALPFLVLFLAMNPWRRFLRSFFGWYVRLGKGASENRKTMPRADGAAHNYMAAGKQGSICCTRSVA